MSDLILSLPHIEVFDNELIFTQKYKFAVVYDAGIVAGLPRFREVAALTGESTTAAPSSN